MWIIRTFTKLMIGDTHWKNIENHSECAYVIAVIHLINMSIKSVLYLSHEYFQRECKMATDEQTLILTSNSSTLFVSDYTLVLPIYANLPLTALVKLPSYF